MRILVVTHNYPRFAGDHAGSFVARLATRTAAQGHSVLVVAPHAPGAAGAEVMDGVRVQRFRYGPDALERVAYRGDLHRRSLLDPLAVLGVPALVASFGIAVRREIRRFTPDLVHAHWWFPGGTLALAGRPGAGAGAGRGGPVPVIVTCHGSDVRLLDRGGPVRAMGARTLCAASAVTCVSQFLARDVERAVPALGGKVRTIYMPLDTAPFDAVRGAARAAPPRILFVGNLVEGKGTAVLLDAFAKLRRQGIDCRLRIVGGGVEEARLRARAAAAGVADHIEWAGFVPHDRIAGEYAAATVVVLPSRGQGEGLGLVLGEALLSGTAVVGTPAGGIPEVVIDEQTGLIARDGDADHLAAQLSRVLTDRTLRERLTAAGEAHAGSLFAPDRAAAAFEALYREVAAQ